MKTHHLLTGVLIITLLFSFRFQNKKYACLPCGRSCDGTQVAKDGSCGECGMRLVDVSTIKFKTVDFAQLCSRLKANKQLLLLDVRSPEEFDNTMKDHDSFGKFKGALNINITELPSRVSELNKFKNSEIIVYCSHSHRSPEASYYLSTHGFANVTNVAGGVSVFKESTGAACLKDRYVAFPEQKAKN